ncbi:MAG TPA: hypothetical protein VH084_09635 [Mycobacterium sp.]|jgi:uncharacterized membrane protein YdjX (TVP38/TMEM64 family)|nr:hypothetical protein [Mycobacterium sp.]
MTALIGEDTVMFYLLPVKHLVNIEDMRRTVKATRLLAPLVYVVLSAVLGAIFVPDPLSAASSGLPFGLRNALPIS